MEREKLSDGIAIRLKELRQSYTWTDEKDKERSLSHKKLSEMIEEKYKVKITDSSLKNYETPAQGYSKSMTNLGMNIEYLYVLADFYGVTADYILGRDSIQISDEAKRNLFKIINTPYKDMLNSFLSSSSLPKIIRSLDITRQSIHQKLHKVWQCSDTTELGVMQTEARHMTRDNTEDMQRELEHLLGNNALKDAIKIRRKALEGGYEDGN